MKIKIFIILLVFYHSHELKISWIITKTNWYNLDYSRISWIMKKLTKPTLFIVIFSCLCHNHIDPVFYMSFTLLCCIFTCPALKKFQLKTYAALIENVFISWKHLFLKVILLFLYYSSFLKHLLVSSLKF